jgi:uncharacterized membrane protein YbjE (DUF340 family)
MIKYIVSALVLGIGAGYLNSNWGSIGAGFWVSDYVFNGALIVLLFVMGLVFGLDKESVSKIRRMGLKILVIPIAVALGSILGGTVSALVLGLDVVKTMTVTAGYGWYTLAGPLVGQLFGAQWGALGFVVNFLRELFTIVTISVTARIDKYAPIALGGATTMDTTLPVIVRCCGSDSLIAAFSSGFTLSIIAPFTIIAVAALR